jgi:hypothetical protein
MIKMIKLVPFPREEMATSLNNIVMPTLKYGQEALTLTKDKWVSMQQPITHAILPKTGYNWHPPIALVYHRKVVGVIGIQNLYTKQGLAQIQYIIGGWRLHKEVTITLKTLLQSYVVLPWITTNPLEVTHIFPHFKSG